MALPPDGFLAEPDELAKWLPVPADHPKLLEALRAASRRFAGAVRHPVRLVVADVVTLYGECTDRLPLPAAPVTEVTSVRVDGVLLDPSGYRVRKDAGILRRMGGVWEDWAEVEVLWSHGYDPIPQDIQEAVIDQARTIYRVQPGVQTVQAGGESITYGAQAAVGVTSQWQAAVDAYQLNRGDGA